MPSASCLVSVLAGQKRQKVGLIPLAPGMLTNRGVVTRVTERGVVFTKENGREKERRTRSLEKLSVRLTEARKFGYPDASGCERLKETTIRRGNKIIPV